jgi:hypothetical protein
VQGNFGKRGLGICRELPLKCAHHELLIPTDCAGFLRNLRTGVKQLKEFLNNSFATLSWRREYWAEKKTRNIIFKTRNCKVLVDGRLYRPRSGGAGCTQASHSLLLWLSEIEKPNGI